MQDFFRAGERKTNKSLLLGESKKYLKTKQNVTLEMETHSREKAYTQKFTAKMLMKAKTWRHWK